MWRRYLLTKYRDILKENNPMFKPIRDALYSLVNGLVATTDLSQVYGYSPKSLNAWFVSAVVTPVESIENVYDTRYNETIYPYEVNVFMPNSDPANDEWAFLELIDDIMLALRQDETLNWLVLWAIFRVRFGYTADEQPMRFCQIQCQYRALNDVT